MAQAEFKLSPFRGLSLVQSNAQDVVLRIVQDEENEIVQGDQGEGQGPATGKKRKHPEQEIEDDLPIALPTVKINTPQNTVDERVDIQLDVLEIPQIQIAETSSQNSPVIETNEIGKIISLDTPVIENSIQPSQPTPIQQSHSIQNNEVINVVNETVPVISVAVNQPISINPVSVETSNPIEIKQDFTQETITPEALSQTPQTIEIKVAEIAPVEPKPAEALLQTASIVDVIANDLLPQEKLATVTEHIIEVSIADLNDLSTPKEQLIANIITDKIDAAPHDVVLNVPNEITPEPIAVTPAKIQTENNTPVLQQSANNAAIISSVEMNSVAHDISVQKSSSDNVSVKTENATPDTPKAEQSFARQETVFTASAPAEEKNDAFTKQDSYSTSENPVTPGTPKAENFTQGKTKSATTDTVKEQPVADTYKSAQSDTSRPAAEKSEPTSSTYEVPQNQATQEKPKTEQPNSQQTEQPQTAEAQSFETKQEAAQPETKQESTTPPPTKQKDTAFNDFKDNQEHSFATEDVKDAKTSPLDEFKQEHDSMCTCEKCRKAQEQELKRQSKNDLDTLDL